MFDQLVAPPTDLNPEQSAACHHLDGPLMIVAGAGTGKTKTLAARVAHLINAGARPDRILLLTFSRRAAREMVRRAASSAGKPAGEVWGGTFHSVAVRVLRRHGRAVGLPAQFSVVDQADATDLIDLVRHDLGLATNKKRFPKKQTIASIYSRMVNAGEKLDSVLERHFPWCEDQADDLRLLLAEFAARKRSHGILDYDDLLLYWRALAATNEPTRTMFDHVLVDEYQDTNPVQAEIISSLQDGGALPTVVGDDAQAIYGFRAASSRNMASFADRFAPATVITLERNYRSTNQILAPSNGVIAEATDLLPKRLWSGRPDGTRPTLSVCDDEVDQANLVCDRILNLREEGTDLIDQAVLFRTGHHSDGLEIELKRRDIPYVKFGGLKFLEAAHIKDLMAVLRVLDNPADELAWRRMLGLLPGVGPAHTTRALQSLGVPDAAPDALTRFLEELPPLPPSAVESATELQSALIDCSTPVAGSGLDASELPASAQIDRLTPWCADAFSRVYVDAPSRVSDLDQLHDSTTGALSRRRFLSDLVLEPPASTSGLAGEPHLDNEYVTLSTIHSAKGGEWKAVHIIHAADGNIPSDMALSDRDGLEEERRLLYVAMTRAKDTLHVSYPMRFHHRRHGLDDAHTLAQPSRFLDSVADMFDRVQTAPAMAPDRAEDHVSSTDPVAELLTDLLA